jgi:hypothetical protein
VRNNLYTLFEQFDFPDPTMPTGSRNSTVVAPQALLMMNSELVMDSAEEFARLLLAQTGDDAGRIRAAYHSALGRLPTEAETRRALTFIGDLIAVRWPTKAVENGDTTALDGHSTTPQQAWALFCQSLFASNEFIYVR